VDDIPLNKAPTELFNLPGHTPVILVAIMGKCKQRHYSPYFIKYS